MSKFKIGDEVLYNGDKCTVVFTFEENEEHRWVSDKYVILDTAYDDIVNTKELELYKSAHTRLLELGYRVSKDSSYNETIYTRKKGVDTIVIDIRDKSYTITTYTPIKLKLSRILTQYLEELNER